MVLAIALEQSGELEEPGCGELPLLLSTRRRVIPAFGVDCVDFPLKLLSVLGLRPGLVPIDIRVGSRTSSNDGQDVFRTTKGVKTTS